MQYDSSAEAIEFKTIAETIAALSEGLIDKAIVPIENSIQGGVTETIDTLIKYDNVYVKKEIILRINHNLLAKENYDLSDIKEIYSHPQAIAQCREFIQSNLPNVNIIPVSSTALAANEVQNKNHCACIANSICTKEYNLTLLHENIQDNYSNFTKFWILGQNQSYTGTKMSLLFSTKHKPGALYQILGIFYNNEINLSKIESRPAKTFLGEYVFLVDIDINENINQAIQEIKRECSYIRILGIYEL